MSHATYASFVQRGTVCVIDENDGMSVTNDIEHVLDDLRRAGVLVAGRRLIYCDSEGVWDEVLLDGGSRFVGFRSLNASTAEEAIRMLER